MNPGIRGLPTQFAQMPRGLLGAPKPILMPDQPWHPEAIDWAARVSANKGVVSQIAIRAVSAFCFDIDTLGIRNRLARFSPFAGGNLLGALVPLYRSFSFGGTVIGNAIDTNVNFVNADFTETGATAGLQGNSSAGKYLNTGIPGNAIATNNIHLGVGVATTSTLLGYKSPIGVFDGGSGMVSVNISGANDRRNAIFGSWGYLTNQAGNAFVFGATSQTGNLVAAYPSFYRNGVIEGFSASAFTLYSPTNPIFVFGLSVGSSSIDLVNVRLSWYSIGLTMTAVQVAAYTAAIANLHAALGRS